MKIIMPVAFDLDRDAHSKVIAGRETKIACDEAMSLSAFSPSDSVIVITAGEAGDDWDRIWMARVMSEYIESRVDCSMWFFSLSHSKLAAI